MASRETREIARTAAKVDIITNGLKENSTVSGVVKLFDCKIIRLFGTNFTPVT